MRKPIISICIPTYNHCEILMTAIQSIISQPEFVNGKVEVCISDNASEDNTQEEILNLQKKFKNIVYNRNIECIGADANFPKVLSLGNGSLHKLSNDTLVYRPNSLKEMCDIVEKYQKSKPVIFWSNGNCTYAPMDIVDFGDFVTLASFWVTWIGGFSIWHEDCEKIEEETNGTKEQLWQVGKIYNMVEKKNKAVIVDVIHGIVCKAEKQKNLNYGIYHVFYENFMSFVKPYLKSGKLTKLQFETIEYDLLYNFFTDWMLSWELKNPEYIFSDKEDLVLLIKKQFHSKPYWSEYERYYKIKKFSLCQANENFKEELKNFIDEIDEWKSEYYIALYLAIKNEIDISKAVDKINSDEFKNIIHNFAITNSDFSKCVLNYGVPSDYTASIKRFFWITTLYEEAVYNSAYMDKSDRFNLISVFIELLNSYILNIYNADLLNEEDIVVLPPIHQFGYYMRVANNALSNGNYTEYIREMKKALIHCEYMKEIIQFLLDYFKLSIEM